MAARLALHEGQSPRHRHEKATWKSAFVQCQQRGPYIAYVGFERARYPDMGWIDHVASFPGVLPVEGNHLTPSLDYADY